MRATAHQPDRIAQRGFERLIGAHHDNELADMPREHRGRRGGEDRRRIEDDDPPRRTLFELRAELMRRRPS